MIRILVWSMVSRLKMRDCSLPGLRDSWGEVQRYASMSLEQAVDLART